MVERHVFVRHRGQGRRYAFDFKGGNPIKEILSYKVLSSLTVPYSILDYDKTQNNVKLRTRLLF